MKNFFTILGGMGTMATESFVRTLNHRTRAEKDQDYLNYILVNHATVPDRTAFILDETKEDPRPALLEDIQQQSMLNPEFMVLTCNTAHYFYDELQAATSIPILHMPREAVKKMSVVYPVTQNKRVALLGTDGSLRAGVYARAIEAAGYQVVLPQPEIQEKVMHLIYQDIKENNHLNEALYFEILRDMTTGPAACQVAILGCTELSLMAEVAAENDFPVIDAQSVLVDVTLERAKKIQEATSSNN